MYEEIMFRYLHFISILVLIATLFGEQLLLKKSMTRKELGRMALIDGIYGLSSLVAVGAGLTLWFSVGKPAQVYTYNWIFLTKVGLLIVIAILSLPPTIFYLKNRKGDDLEELVTVPSSIHWYVRAELIIFIFIPLLATLMSRGIGYFG